MTGGQAILAQARWTLLRMMRTRTVAVALGFALLPIGFTLILSQSSKAAPWHEVVVILAILTAVITPLFMASSLAEEFEGNTFTYLWSRPIPRHSVVLGKLLAAAPLSAAIVQVAVVACFFIPAGAGAHDLLRTAIATTLGALAIASISAGFATWLPRFGLGASYAYLLALDLPVGAIPASLRNLSVTYQIRELSSGTAPLWQPLAWLFGIATVWLVVALLRISRAEYAVTDR